jgi:hypothetical protein
MRNKFKKKQGKQIKSSPKVLMLVGCHAGVGELGSALFDNFLANLFWFMFKFVGSSLSTVITMCGVFTCC